MEHSIAERRSAHHESLQFHEILCDNTPVIQGSKRQMLEGMTGSHRARWSFKWAVGFASLLASLGCSAVYPEMKTRVRAPQPGAGLDPAPSDDLYYIYFDSAWIPPKNQGGQVWQGGAPDPYAKLIVDEGDLIVTPVQPNTRKPTWPKQERMNYRVRPGATIYVEVWDSNPVTNQPICRARVLDLKRIREGGNDEIWCESRARVTLHVEPPHALIGIGLYYETRGSAGVRVTRVVKDSPAARAGLTEGDRILAIQGKKVSQMDALEVRSAINLNARSGLQLDVWFADGKRHLVTLVEGSLFPLPDDDLKLIQ